MAASGPGSKLGQDGASIHGAAEGVFPSLASLVLCGVSQAAVLLGEDKVTRAGITCEQAAAAAWVALGHAGRESWGRLAGAWGSVRAREVEFCKSLGLSGPVARAADLLLSFFTLWCAVVCVAVGLGLASVAAAGSLAGFSLLLGLASGLLFSVSGTLLVLISFVVGPGALLAGLLAAGLVAVVAVPGASHLFRDRFLSSGCADLYSEELQAAHDGAGEGFDFVDASEAQRAAARAPDGPGKPAPQQPAAPPSVESAPGFWQRKTRTPLVKSQVA